ncbi:MAG TPA: undecaprenyldiphospho-muramoylpentapeptide beta-N-acetylglucosaminyltransferase [Thermodesulfobacteriaceae bacterium]|nr:undecaprenyldiphospho-muramoylpentapeptide beta-N-acetylglucosaminyltransferase [Thermodesulfobacteriaceae bacterium]
MKQIKTKEAALRLVIAGGGTGGHVFPGLAVAEALEEISGLDVMWIGTGRPVEKDAMKEKAWQYRILKVRPIKGAGLPATVRSMAGLPFYTLKTMIWLRSFNPHVVLGVGGYVSGPVLLAARMLGIPAAIHEQNLIPGLANRWASKFADSVFVSFRQSTSHFPGKHCIFTGNPVRRTVLRPRGNSACSSDRARILIMGGSQGAEGLNRIVREAMVILRQSGIILEVIHQTGRTDRERTENFYREAGIPVKTVPFIEDMGRAYAWADLAVCRAGAGTLAELTAMGKPSILIPYPAATDSHQEANAGDLAEAGAARFFREGEVGAVRFAEEIRSLLEDRQALSDMAEKARRLGRPEAARLIASSLLDLAGLSTPEPQPEKQKSRGTQLRSHV